MNIILIALFVLLVLPYLGLPNKYDAWISLAMVVVILICVYRLGQGKRFRKPAWVKRLGSGKKQQRNETTAASSKTEKTTVVVTPHDE